jgi:hypothetical protein
MSRLRPSLKNRTPIGFDCFEIVTSRLQDDDVLVTKPRQNPFGLTSPRPCVCCCCRSNQRKYMITRQPFACASRHLRHLSPRLVVVTKARCVSHRSHSNDRPLIERSSSLALRSAIFRGCFFSVYRSLSATGRWLRNPRWKPAPMHRSRESTARPG